MQAKLISVRAEFVVERAEPLVVRLDLQGQRVKPLLALLARSLALRLVLRPVRRRRRRRLLVARGRPLLAGQHGVQGLLELAPVRGEAGSQFHHALALSGHLHLQPLQPRRQVPAQLRHRLGDLENLLPVRLANRGHVARHGPKSYLVVLGRGGLYRGQSLAPHLHMLGAVLAEASLLTEARDRVRLRDSPGAQGRIHGLGAIHQVSHCAGPPARASMA
mmetsp:Transcript_108718/g.307292  ORF Transcript_108718/g.307292 Transcript_108718/m.307292 type:complete len:219 (-) Transcript_108718:7-663(-)